MGGFLSRALTSFSERALTSIEAVARGAAREFLESGGSAVLRELGQHGDVLRSLVRDFYERQRRYAGNFEAEYWNALRPARKHWPTIVKILKGEQVEGPAEAQEAAMKIRGLMDHTYSVAEAAGVKVAPKVPDYFPRKWPDWVFEGRSRQRAISALMARGVAKDAVTADRLLDRLHRYSFKASHLEFPRTAKTLEEAIKAVGIPPREDEAVIPDVLRQAARRIAAAEAFGPDAEVLNGLLTRIREELGVSKYQFAKRYVDIWLREAGAEYSPPTAAERGMASLQVATHLGLAVTAHLGQPLNVVVMAGLRPALKGFLDLIASPEEALEFAIRAGATASPAIDAVRESLRSEFGTLGSRVLRATGFNVVDRWRRVYAAQVAKYLPEEMIARLRRNPSDSYARKMLLELNIDPDRALAHGLADEDFYKAGQRLASLTQFDYTPEHLPVGWRANPYSRMLFMFKRYFYAQTKFMKDHVLMPALEHGEFRPLIYTALLFPTVGELVGDIRMLVRHGDPNWGRPGWDNYVDRLVDNYATAGGLGILHDLFYALASPSDSLAWDFVAGPVLADAVEAIRSVRGLRPFERFVLRRVPVVGPFVATKITPPKRRVKGPLERGALTRRLVGE
jgi:hypothetical protein